MMKGGEAMIVLLSVSAPAVSVPRFLYLEAFYWLRKLEIEAVSTSCRLPLSFCLYERMLLLPLHYMSRCLGVAWLPPLSIALLVLSAHDSLAPLLESDLVRPVSATSHSSHFSG
jgi:hypothetical protein